MLSVFNEAPFCVCVERFKPFCVCVECVLSVSVLSVECVLSVSVLSVECVLSVLSVFCLC